MRTGGEAHSDDEAWMTPASTSQDIVFLSAQIPMEFYASFL